MNKYFITLCITAFIAITAIAQSQEHFKGNGNITKETRVVSDFDKIAIAGSIDLTIDQNGKEELAVETDQNLQNLIITEVKDGTLNIHVKNGVSVSYNKINVHVSCKQLKMISSGGSGNVNSVSKINSGDFSISSGGSGNYKLELNVDDLKISSGGSGNFTLKGNAEEVNYTGAGSGNVNAKELNISETCNISIAGSGDVKLKKGTKAKVSSVGSGDVSYE